MFGLYLPKTVVLVILNLLFLILIPFFLSNYQDTYYCRGFTVCKTWSAVGWFILINSSLGFIIWNTVIMSFLGKKISILLKACLVFCLFIYLVLVFVFFTIHITATPSYIEVEDNYINHVGFHKIYYTNIQGLVLNSYPLNRGGSQSDGYIITKDGQSVFVGDFSEVILNYLSNKLSINIQYTGRS